MQRRMVVLFVGICSVLARSAAAVDAPKVEIYGTLLPFAENVRTAGVTGAPPADRPNQVPAGAYGGVNLPSRFRITSGTSNLGFRGNVGFSDAWKAIFQVEAAVPVDGVQAPQGVFASRNSQVGVSGPYGTLFYGIWDTPYKWTTIQIAPLRGLNPFDYDNILENPGFGVPGTTTQSGRANGKADAAFSRRQGGSIQYWSPNLFGFSARGAYSVNAGSTLLDANHTVSPDLWSFSLAYENGPFMLRYAFERHGDYFGMAQIGGSPGATVANASSRDFAHKLVGGVSLGGTRFNAAVERLQYDTGDTAPGAVQHYRRDAYYLQIVQRIDAAGAWVGFGQAFDGECSLVGGATCSTNGLGAWAGSIGAMYDLVRNATVYAAYYGVRASDSSSYGIFPGFGTVAPGAKSRGVGIGIIYSFDAAITR